MSLGNTVTGTMTFRVVIVDDVEWVREMLADLLNDTPGVEVCGSASDGVEAVSTILRLRPDIVLMDLKMPRMDGITAAAEVLAVWPEAKIVINSAYGDTSLVEQANDVGVVGYVTKDQRPSELIEELLSLQV